MYVDHVPTIAAAMRSNPESFARGVAFVIASIRERIVDVPPIMASIDAVGENAPKLFSHKRDAFRYVQSNKVQLWRDVCGAVDTAAAIRVLCQVPGLGIVKGAFVCQLMGLDVGCLDSRNIQREGRDINAYRVGGPKTKTGPAFVRKVARYVADTGGRAREYWDAWCIDVADAYGRTADAISAIHLDCIVPVAYRATIAPIACPICANDQEIPF